MNLNPFIQKLSVCAVLMGFAFIIHDRSLFCLITAIVTLGFLFAHFVELQHQCIHGTAFKSKRVNSLVGFLLGLPYGISFTHYKVSHLLHHKNLGTSSDKEFIDYQTNKGLLWGLFSLNRFNFVNYLRGLNNFKFYRSQILLEKSLMLFFAFCFALWSIQLFFYLWVIPLLLIAHPLHFLIEFPEHYKCSRSSKDASLNTRSILAPSKFLIWLTNFNHLHVEHHKYQWVTPEELEEFGKQRGIQKAFCSKSYFLFYKSIILKEDVNHECFNN